MKTTLLAATVIASAFSAVSAQAALDFASLPGSSIEFFGTASQFQITPSTGDAAFQWNITSVGPAMGLRGAFTGGPWAYGPVTSVVPGVLETANVIGPLGNFVIDDGAGHSASGQVDWVQLSTFFSAGALNANASVNITGMQYDGSNSDLLNLVANGNGSVNMSFQFNPAMDLLQLSNGAGPYETSYSGSFAPFVAAPEPGTWMAGAFALLVLVPVALRRRGSLRILGSV
jgi:hypothetical protein